MTVGFIGATIPAKVLRVSGTTLFQIAMQQTGDPLQWVAIAELNGITDPWIVGLTTLLIPPIFPTGAQTGILDGIGGAPPPPQPAAVVSVASPLPPPPPPSTQSEPVPIIF
jgi:hypothetical protein